MGEKTKAVHDIRTIRCFQREVATHMIQYRRESSLHVKLEMIRYLLVCRRSMAALLAEPKELSQARG